MLFYCLHFIYITDNNKKCLTRIAKEPDPILFDTIAQYFSEHGVTVEEVKQRFIF